MVITISKDNFQKQVEKAGTPVLVDLWAPWCVYCRRLSPVLDRLSEKYGDALPIAKINIDEEPELSDVLNADVIPTLYLYKNGKHGEKLVAPSSQSQIEKWIDAQNG